MNPPDRVSLLMAVLDVLAQRIRTMIMYEVKGKRRTKLGPPEHVALAILTSGSCLLMDYGKTLVSLLLEPGHEGKSLEMMA